MEISPAFLPVLTASIDPRGMTFLTVADTQTRRHQYLTAFSAILRNPPAGTAGILFTENTGADLSDFRALADDPAINSERIPVEFLSEGSNDFPRELGKGYGEFLMLDGALARSTIAAVSASAGSRFLVKMTGRLIVKNLHVILHNLPRNFDFAGDISVATRDQPGTVDSRLMIFTPEFYRKYISGLYAEMNDTAGVYAEHALYNLLARTPGLRVLTTLPRQPRWCGCSGSFGNRYDSLSQRLKYPIKALRRAFTRVPTPILTPLPPSQ